MSTTEMRPARTTDYLHLPVPGDAGAADALTVVGDLADAIDALAGTGRFGYDTGDIKPSARRTPPTGWLLCNGQAVDRGVFSDLFTEIGTDHGPGDGSTTFNVPDLRGAFPQGAANPAALGGRGGAATHTLNVNEMPSHDHGGALWDPGHAHGVADPQHGHAGPPVNPSYAGWGRANITPSGGTGVPSNNNFAGNTGTAPAGTGIGIYGAYTGARVYGQGANWAHNNLPPFVNINYFIKT